MKIKIEIDEGLPEDEVLIRCRGLTEQIADVQKAVSEVINTSQKFVFYRGNTEYYLTLDEILFFETALSVTFNFCANCACVKPFSFLNSVIKIPNF